jgi:hypothetical protein
MVEDGVETDLGKMVAFPSAHLVVGRGEGADLRLDDPSVSRRHLELVRGPKGIYLRDLGSDWGSKVNGKWVDERLLHHDDVIELGVTRLRYQDEEDAAKAEAAEKAQKEEEEKRQREEAAAKAQAEQAAAEPPPEEQPAAEAAPPPVDAGSSPPPEEQEALAAPQEPEEEEPPPVSAPPGLSLDSWRALNGPQRLAVFLFTLTQIALIAVVGSWLWRPAKPPEDPKQTSARKVHEQGVAMWKAGRLHEAVSSLEAAEKLWPGTDADHLLQKAKKEVEAQRAFEDVQELLRQRRYEEARARLGQAAPSSRELKATKELLLAQLDNDEAAAFQELRVRAALVDDNLPLAKALAQRLPDEARLAMNRLIGKREDAKVTDTATPAQKEARRKHMEVAFQSVAKRFQARDFDGVIAAAVHLEELTPGEMTIHERVDRVKALVPQFKAAFEEGKEQSEAKNYTAAFVPLLYARQLYREIGFQGPLGPMIDDWLTEAAVASGREALARNDLAVAAMRFRDAAVVAPKDERVLNGLDTVGRKAGRILAETYERDRVRAPRLYVEKLELVRELAPKGSSEVARATELLRLVDADGPGGAP